MKGLGEKIRFLRKARKLTLVEIARKTGIDQATLSRIENDLMTGTLESHMKLADVLGISLTDLYKETVDKLNNAKELTAKKKFETFSHSGGAVSELLTTGILHKKMMPTLIKFKPHGHTATEEYPMFTERLLYVTKGSIEVEISKTKQTLKTGDSLYFDAGQPHHFRNPLKTESICLSVMTPTSL